jgi:hypothetical protein
MQIGGFEMARKIKRINSKVFIVGCSSCIYTVYLLINIDVDAETKI